EPGGRERQRHRAAGPRVLRRHPRRPRAERERGPGAALLPGPGPAGEAARRGALTAARELRPRRASLDAAPAPPRARQIAGGGRRPVGATCLHRVTSPRPATSFLPQPPALAPVAHYRRTRHRLALAQAQPHAAESARVV